MDDETRSAAFVKLGQIVDLIGYPDIWTDYGSLYIQPHQFFENVLYSTQFSVLQTVGRLGTKVRKDIWQMTAPTVNAYYDPTLNTINFPAGIIQPTLFSLDYPMAINYGGFGATAGHELSHGFDDQGRQYDGTGKLTTWWTNSSVENFKVRAQCYIDQYSGYSVLGTHLHGDQTLGENIADNSGLKCKFSIVKIILLQFL
jgi:predicted metalloendopeptidase